MSDLRHAFPVAPSQMRGEEQGMAVKTNVQPLHGPQGFQSRSVHRRLLNWL